MSIEPEELMIVSMCAACFHTNSYGNEDRMVEIQETINLRENASVLRSLDIGFCDDQTLLVR